MSLDYLLGRSDEPGIVAPHVEETPQENSEEPPAFTDKQSAQLMRMINQAFAERGL